MAEDNIPVFQAYFPECGFVFKAKASDISWKQDAYCERVREDDPEQIHDYEQVVYTANAKCDYTLYIDGEEKAFPTTEAKAELKARPVFFETQYFFRGAFKDGFGEQVKDVRVTHRLAAVSNAFNYEDGVLVGVMNFINEPGRFQLELRIDYKNGQSRYLKLDFMVVSVKMNIQRDYQAIIQTIDAERPNLVQASLSKTQWGAKLVQGEKTNNWTWYDILEDVFEYYEQACQQIVNDPHRRYVKQTEWNRPDRIRRWTPSQVLAFHRGNKEEYLRIRTERLSAISNTPENQFVLYTLKELCKRLVEFEKEIRNNEKVAKSWKDGILERKTRLETLVNHPFFRGVSAFQGLRSQSLVLQRRAGYAQILSSWITLNSALKPGGDDISIGHRPISTLYEFWCYLKMRDLLANLLNVEGVPQYYSDEGSLLETPELTDDYSGDSALCKIDTRFTSNDGDVIVLSYQKTYRDGYKEDEDVFSGLNPQRPDIILSIKRDDSVFTYLFDAKYRIYTKRSGDKELDLSPRDAIDDMHRYRDAILYRLQKADLKHEVIGAYVLYPGRPEPHNYPGYEPSIARENIGAFPLLPNNCAQLEAYLEEIITRGTAKDHLEKVIPTRGTSAVLGNDMPFEGINWENAILLVKGHGEPTFVNAAIAYCRSLLKHSTIVDQRYFYLPESLVEHFGVTAENAHEKTLLLMQADGHQFRLVLKNYVGDIDTIHDGLQLVDGIDNAVTLRQVLSKDKLCYCWILGDIL